jgi:hypothetical protein
MTFVHGLPLIQRQNTIECSLFAQEIANYQHNPFTEQVEWTQAYVLALTNLGWLVEDLDFTQYDITTENVSVSKIVIEILSKIASGQELDIAADALEALRQLPEDADGAKLWESTSHDPTKGNFHIGTATWADGYVQLNPAALHVLSSETMKRILWFSFTRGNATISTAGTTMLFDVSLYSQVAADVKARLGNDIRNYVKEVPTTPPTQGVRRETGEAIRGNGADALPRFAMKPSVTSRRGPVMKPSVTTTASA